MRDAIDAVRDALATLFPVSCGGCGAADRRMCATCLDALRGAIAPAISEPDGADFWVATATTYTPVLRVLVENYKERGRADLARELARILRVALGAAVREVTRVQQPADPILLVPVPSRRAARVRRGYDHVSLLLERAVPRARAAQALRHTRRIADQSGLSRDARARNLVGAFVASPSVQGRACLVVDDLVTTGATLREAGRALSAAGGIVLGAVAIARVERLYHTKNSQALHRDEL